MDRMLIVACVLIQVFPCIATIRNVPAEHATIGAAIEVAEAGDTVLVARGTYNESINFGGKAIIVAGNYLLTADPADIDATILSHNGSLVRFDSGEDNNSRFTGFTLRNGTGSRDLDGQLAGGGIHCLDSSPELSYLKITHCSARYGAGIFLQRSSPGINNVEIFGNDASRSGGGIYISRQGSNPIINNTLIHHNYADPFGDAIGVYQGANPIFMNCTMAGRDFNGNAGGEIVFYLGCTVRLINCVIPSQVAAQVGGDRASDTLFVDYSCITGGRDNIYFPTQSGVVIWGEGNIEVDPMFTDFDNGDLSPSWANFPTEDESVSPLIDTGDPDSPADTDGSRADMGAVPFVRGGILLGEVRSDDIGNVIPGATIFEPRMPTLTADSSGAFLVRNHPAGQFNLLVTAPGYNDTLLSGLELAMLDTLALEIRLLNPTLSPVPDELQIRITEGTRRDVQIELQNEGNGRLEFHAETHATGAWAFEVGELRASYYLQGILDADRFRSPVMVDDRYYIPAYSSITLVKSIFVLDRQGDLIDAFPQQPNSARYGIRSLASDGENLWGCFDVDTLICFDLNGEIISITTVPGVRTIQNLTWDSDRNLLWVSATTTSIFAFDPQSNEVVDSLNSPSFRIYGLGYYPLDPDDYQIYVRANQNGRSMIYKMQVGDSDTMLVSQYDSTIIGGYGAFIAHDFDRFQNTVLITVNWFGEITYNLEVLQISRSSVWSRVLPVAGAIEAGHSGVLTLSLDASSLIPEFYPGEIRIDHNALGFRTTVPFSLTVTPLSVPSLNPSSFNFSIPFPNPFNGRAIVEFSLPRTGLVHAAIYDLEGRKVLDMANQPFSAGSHSLGIELENEVSGVYFLKLDANGESFTRKLILMR